MLTSSSTFNKIIGFYQIGMGAFGVLLATIGLVMGLTGNSFQYFFIESVFSYLFSGLSFYAGAQELKKSSISKPLTLLNLSSQVVRIVGSSFSIYNTCGFFVYLYLPNFQMDLGFDFRAIVYQTQLISVPPITINLFALLLLLVIVFEKRVFKSKD